MTNGIPTAISEQVELCIMSFDKLCDDLKKIDKSEDLLSKTNRQYDRFKHWYEKIGARQKDLGSLDYKLRDWSRAGNDFITLLKELRTILIEASAFIDNLENPFAPGGNARPLDNESKRSFENFICSIFYKLWRLNSKSLHISYLPLPHDLIKEFADIDMSHHKDSYTEYVRNEFPDAKEYLIKRLGEAMTRRRQCLDCYRQRKESSKKATEKQKVIARTDDGDFQSKSNSLEPRRSAVKALKALFSRLKPTKESPDEEPRDQVFRFTLTHTCPSLPRRKHDGTFDCPICDRSIPFHHDSNWHQHILDDTRPYVCTVEGCRAQSTIYEHEDDWRKHENACRTSAYFKCIECGEELQSPAHFSYHIGSDHLCGRHDDPSVDELIPKSRRVSRGNPTVDRQCPLCKTVFNSQKDMIDHLAKHHEDLARYMLCSYMGDESANKLSAA